MCCCLYCVLPVRSPALLDLLPGQYTLRQPGDYLLSQLGACCPKLRQLHMADVAIDGRGIKLAAGAAARAAAAAGGGAAGGEADAGLAKEWGGVGGLQGLQRLELRVKQMMRSTVS